MEGPITILQGDVRETLAALEPCQFHAVVTSPPYWALRSYLSTDSPLKPLELGSERTPEEFISNLVGVFALVRRVLRDDGLLWVNLGETMGDGGRCGIPERFALAMQADGWLWRDTVIWHKPAPMPSSVSGWRWERCKVKVRNVPVEETKWKKDKLTGVDMATGQHHEVEWQPCPGCPKCQPHGGYVLRKGAGRTTTAHEYIFMFAKKSPYFYDQVATLEEAEAATLERERYTRVLDDPDEQFAVAHDHESFSGGKRNPRSVWTIGPEPLKHKHYAAFPSELVHKCLLPSVSARGCCPTCGGQWARVVETNGYHSSEHITPKGKGRQELGLQGAGTGLHETGWRKQPTPKTTTLSFRPTCSCGEAAPVPCRVCDPFGGSGTVALEAVRMGHHATLCELNPAYIEIMRARFTEEMPLLALST